MEKKLDRSVTLDMRGLAQYMDTCTNDKGSEIPIHISENENMTVNVALGR